MAPPRGLPAPFWARCIASGLGSGLLRPAPGTWGSLAAALAWLALRRAAHGWPGAGPQSGWLWWGVLPAAALTWLGIRAATAVVRATGEKDPSWIVVDEWAGQWIALIPLWFLVSPAALPPLLDARALLPILAFRVFDIWKPGVIHHLQALPEGHGIVMDDVQAGLYAAILTSLCLPWLRGL